MSGRPIGVLALQGAFARHCEILNGLGRTARLVRKPDDLAGLGGLIIPGGESTVMGRLLKKSGLYDGILTACGGGLPVFGTCAGLIILSAGTDGNDPGTLGLLDVRIARNGYGRQRNSFRAGLSLPPEYGKSGKAENFDGVFIRAPRILSAGRDVEVLIARSGEPVLIRQGNILACSFHPELTGTQAVHSCFLDMIC